MRRSLRPAACCLAIGLLGAGCADLNAPPTSETVEFWEAELAPVGSPDAGPDRPVISGEAAAIVRTHGTEAGLAIVGAPEDGLLRWGVYTGDCEEPGALLPTAFGYPALSGQQPEATVQLPARLVQSNSYHVAVSTDGDGERLSCGELVRQQ